MFFPNTEQLTRQVTFIKGAKNTQATLTMVQTILLDTYTRLMLLNDFFKKKIKKEKSLWSSTDCHEYRAKFEMDYAKHVMAIFVGSRIEVYRVISS